MKEETELDSVLGQTANIRLHAWSPSQWTLNFVPSVYRNGIPMENQTPNKRASGLGLGLSVAYKNMLVVSVTEQRGKFHYV